MIGNFIGTDLTGTAGPGYAGNGEWGINIEDGPSAAVITDNVIGNNGDDGIRVAGHDTFDTIIARNRIAFSRMVRRSRMTVTASSFRCVSPIDDRARQHHCQQPSWRPARCREREHP